MILRFLREKAAWLLSGFLLLALLSFILGDFLVGRKGLSSHTATDDAIVGQIGDRFVYYTEFNNLVTDAINRQKALNPNPVGDVTLNDAIIYTNVVQAIWNQLITETLISKATSEIGLSVSDYELFDMIEGSHIEPEVKQFFGIDPNSTMDPNIIHNFVNQFSQPGSDNLKLAWSQFEKYLIKKRLIDKYVNLLSKSVFFNSLEAQSNSDFYNTSANLDYIVINSSNLKKEDVTINDAELQHYYKTHKHIFKNDVERRDMNYAVLNIVPSSEDSIKVQQTLTNLIPKFKHTNQDSLFASINSDNNQQLISFTSQKDTNPAIAQTLFDVRKKGSVYGPYLDGNSYKLAKLIYINDLYDKVNLRHILLSPSTPLSKAKDIFNDISTKKISFQNAAKEFSLDEATKLKGGELGWLSLDMTLPESFKDNCFSQNSPKLQIIKSKFGTHIVEILDKGDLSQKAKIAYITKIINASQATRDGYFAKMQNALSELNATKDLKTVSAKFGLQYFANEAITPWGPYDNLNASNSHIETYKHRKLIQWLFKSKLKDISPITEENDSYSIGQVIKIEKIGYEPFNEVKNRIEPIVKKEKSDDRLINILNESLSRDPISLGDIAKQYNTIVKKGYNIGVLSNDYEVYGAIVGSKVKQISKPISGNDGVYLFYINDKTTVKDNNSLSQWQVLQAQKNQQILIGDIITALKTNIKIIDNRVMLL